MLVDVDAFALQNCYEMNYDVEEGKVIALVNIGASVTNVNVLSGGTRCSGATSPSAAISTPTPSSAS